MLLIIGGMPRSGTTMARTVCNAHPDIFIASEMPAATVQQPILDCLQAMQADQERRGTIADFRAREERLVAEMFFAMNRNKNNKPGVRAAFERAHIHGNKTPSAEHCFTRYEELLGHHAPRYVYCLRDPVACLNSRVKMPWRVLEFDALLEKLRDSYRAFLAALDAFPERMFVFRLEEFAARPEDVATRLCEFLKVDTGPVETMIAQDKANSLATLKKRGNFRDRELSDAEVEAVRADPLVSDVTERFVWQG